MSSFDKTVRAKLDALMAANALRTERVLAAADGAFVEVGGKRLLSLASNNYLGLSQNTELRAAAIQALDQWGVGSGGSRLVCGTTNAHRQCEDAFAAYVERPAAMYFANAYAANLGVIPALFGEGDLILSDALNHASLIDACRLSRAEKKTYAHLDLEAVENILRAERARHKHSLLVSEAAFSMDGDCADMAGLRALADRYECQLMIDEAHSIGVFGPGGRGLCAQHGVEPDIGVYGLGKAFGLFGAFVSASDETIRLLRSSARAYIYTTAAPAFWLEVVKAGIGLVERADAARATVMAHAERLRSGLQRAGLHVKPGTAPIIPLIIGTNDASLKIAALCAEKGLFVQAIRPPTVPEGTSRLRLVPTAAHTSQDIEHALSLLIEACRAQR